MAKLSGLVSGGKIGKADQWVVDAMPNAPASALDSSKVLVIDGNQAALEPRESSESITLESSDETESVSSLPLSKVRPSPYQVRAVADSEYIETLMASIVQSGVISPIVVRMLDSSNYEVIAGHHRLEASRRLGHSNVPVVVRQMSDSEAACALASDNFVRKELSDYERYKHAKLLRDFEFCKTYSEIGQVLGVSRQLVGFLFAFEAFSVGVKAILELNPNILGATQANELKEIARKEPVFFEDAISLLADGRLRQNQIGSWITAKCKPSSIRMQRRQEIKITKPGFRAPIKMIFTDSEVKIQAVGLNMNKLKQLIEENLEALIAPD